MQQADNELQLRESHRLLQKEEQTYLEVLEDRHEHPEEQELELWGLPLLRRQELCWVSPAHFGVHFHHCSSSRGSTDLIESFPTEKTTVFGIITQIDVSVVDIGVRFLDEGTTSRVLKYLSNQFVENLTAVHAT
jgi:hypothetical protein